MLLDIENDGIHGYKPQPLYVHVIQALLACMPGGQSFDPATQLNLPNNLSTS